MNNETALTIVTESRFHMAARVQDDIKNEVRGLFFFFSKVLPGK